MEKPFVFEPDAIYYTANEGGVWTKLPYPLDERVVYDILFEYDTKWARVRYAQNTRGRLPGEQYLLPVCIPMPESKLLAHAIRMPDGRKWDIINGWRKK